MNFINEHPLLTLFTTALIIFYSWIFYEVTQAPTVEDDKDEFGNPIE